MPGDDIDWEDVLADAQTRLEADPSDPDAGRMRAQAIGALGDEERALLLIEEHLNEHPADERAWDLRSAYLMAIGDYDEAVVSSDRALALAPDEGILRYNRACALSLAGRIDEALEDLGLAIACDEELRAFAEEDDSFEGLQVDRRFRALVGRA